MSEIISFKDRVIIFPNGSHAFANKAKCDAVMVEEDGAIYTMSIGDKEWKAHPPLEEEEVIVTPPVPKKPRKKNPGGNGASTH